MIFHCRINSINTGVQQVLPVQEWQHAEVWELVSRYVQLRTAETTTTKVKSHSTPELVGQRDYDGNQKADELAEEGVRLHLMDEACDEAWFSEMVRIAWLQAIYARVHHARLQADLHGAITGTEGEHRDEGPAIDPNHDVLPSDEDCYGPPREEQRVGPPEDNNTSTDRSGGLPLHREVRGMNAIGTIHNLRQTYPNFPWDFRGSIADTANFTEAPSRPGVGRGDSTLRWNYPKVQYHALKWYLEHLQWAEYCGGYTWIGELAIDFIGATGLALTSSMTPQVRWTVRQALAVFGAMLQRFEVMAKCQASPAGKARISHMAQLGLPKQGEGYNRRAKLMCPDYVHGVWLEIQQQRTDTHTLDYTFTPPGSESAICPIDDMQELAKPPRSLRNDIRDAIGLERDYKIAYDDNLWQERIKQHNESQVGHDIQSLEVQRLVLPENLRQQWRAESPNIKIFTCTLCKPQEPWKFCHIGSLLNKDCPSRQPGKRPRTNVGRTSDARNSVSSLDAPYQKSGSKRSADTR